MSLDWLALGAEAEEASPANLKARIDLVAACEHLGIAMEPDATGTKFHGICPFHDDDRPSLDVYTMEDGSQRVGCLACDFGPVNDVFDLIQRARGCGFSDALRYAITLAEETRAGVEPRRDAVARSRAAAIDTVDLAAFVEAASRRAASDDSAIQTFIHDRDLDVTSDFLRHEFGVGVTPDGRGVVVPLRSADGAVIAAKIRRAEVDAGRPWKPVAIRGSRLSELYGTWRDRGHRRVIIVEGESDAWTVARRYQDAPVDVFGLPSGAAARPRPAWVSALAGREVTLCFDADDGGRVALRNWLTALGVARVARLEEGRDAASTPARTLRLAIDSAFEVGTSLAPGLTSAPFGGYVTADQTPVSDFVVRLERTIALEDEAGHVFEVTMPDGRRSQLPSQSLETDRALRRWANDRGYVWSGSTRHAQELLRLLHLESVAVPWVHGTNVAGLVDGRAFAWPEESGGAIGTRAWTYVPPVSEVDLGKMLNLRVAPYDPRAIVDIAHLHRPDVITPIIGWVAASPLRALARAFPMLAVVGGSGFGKSTLIRAVLESLGFGIATTLTSTTPYGIASFVTCTNAAPVWVDEYRRGARRDTREAFEQLLRDAWEGLASYKGGRSDNLSKLTKVEAIAPLLITGEDAFIETSHLERMVTVPIPSRGRSPETLATLRSRDTRGLGRAYLDWLVVRLNDGTMPALPNLLERSAQAQAVARWGYGLWVEFARDVVGDAALRLPQYDDTLVAGAARRGADKPVIIEVLEACESRVTPNGPVAWRNDQDEWCLRLHDLVSEARRLELPLPGGARALRLELEERYEVIEEAGAWGRYLRLATRA